MKSLKTKVIMSAIVLVFALIATIGSTYAWFTVTTTNTVSGITLTVKSEKSLVFMISDSGVTDEEDVVGDYVTSLDNADFTALNAVGGSQYNGFTSWRLGAVTAAVGGTDLSLAYTGLLSSNVVTLLDYDHEASSGKHSTASFNSSAGGYIRLDFWLKNNGDVTETATLQDLTVSSTGVPQLVNAIRIATHSDGSAGTPDAIFAPVVPDYNFAFPDTTVLTGPVQAALVADHSEFYSSTTDLSGVSTTTIGGAASIVSLTPTVPTLVSVYIYLEGWDIDTNQLILNASFNVTFTFALQ